MPTYLHAQASFLHKLRRLKLPRIQLSAQRDSILLTHSTGHHQILNAVKPENLQYDHLTRQLTITITHPPVIIEKCPRQVYQNIIDSIAKTQNARHIAPRIAQLANSALQAVQNRQSPNHWMSQAGLNRIQNLAALPPDSRDPLVLELLSQEDRQICFSS